MQQASQIPWGFDKSNLDAGLADADTPSLLYAILPPIVQRRIPKLRSLRQTAGTYGRPTAHARSTSDASDASMSPPPSYRTSARTSICESDDDEPAVFRSLPPSRPSSSGSATPAYREETESGVRWKYAMQGHALLSLSTQEASSHTQNPRFSRKLYIDSVEYLLNGLPSDMTAHEELSLRTALPDSLLLLPSSSSDNQLAVPSVEHNAEPTPAAPEPSVLHHAVASITLYAFLLISFVLPYVQLFLQEAYRYDRKHKISDRLFAQGVMAADTVGKQTLVLANNVCAMNDGRVGEAVKEVGMWWVQGVSGGVYEGVGEGMQVLGLRATGSRKGLEGRSVKVDRS